MLTARKVAQWFIFNNPELASGFIDENTKVNKLLYFSNLMYTCVKKDRLISDEFVAFPNGPVVFSVYRDYRYSDLSSLPTEIPDVEDEQKKILEIVNFVYGNYSTKELIDESHTHSQWKNVKHLIPNNPTIDFDNIDQNLISYFESLYLTYSEFDFNMIAKEKICGNIYYYYKDSFDMTDKIIDELSSFEKFGEPKFIEVIDGELVIS
ncbi:MAG: DUF4065 domain-containing protein [Acutalibacteraceae bacterium]|nr:DUF4065 domain-containing protein [Acutalibacteraceae bacterium]